MTKILTIGTALQDITFTTSEGQILNTPQNLTAQKVLAFELGAKFNIKKADFTFGGGAANIAVGLAKLGQKTAILTCLGNDCRAEANIKNLKKYKIETKYIMHSEKNTALAFILSAENFKNEHTIFIHRGASEDLKIDFSELTQPKSKKNQFDLIYLSSLSGFYAKNNLSNIFRYKTNFPEVKIIWNPGGEQIKLGLNALAPYLKQTKILIINKDEAMEFCLNEKTLENPNNPRILLKILSSYAPSTIVITDGENGAYALENNKIYYIPSRKVTTKNTTGVGDAFGIGFVWSYLIMGFNIEKSLNLGIKNSLSVLKSIGAQEGLLNQTEILS